MGKFIDLTGQVFTYLKVLNRATNRGSATMWLCECVCGKQKNISACDLRGGKVKGCGGICDYQPRKRIEGKRFGNLIVKKFLPGERSLDKDSRPMWEVECCCGFRFKTTLHALNPGKNRKGKMKCINCEEKETKGRLVGRSYYYLVVIQFSHENKWGNFIWKCQCRCGNFVLVSTSSLERATTKSCGCYTIDRLRKGGHGKSKTSIYRVWNHARRRCHLASDSSYKRYGGRGITMCSEWLNDFRSFEFWALENGYTTNLQIDRIDVDKGYSPDNCQFVTKNCNSAFAWIDKMDRNELKKVEIRIAARLIYLDKIKNNL